MGHKVLFVFLYSVLLTGHVQAQESLSERGRTATSCSPVNYASEQINKLYVKPPAHINQLKSGIQAKCDIQVTYVDFPEEAVNSFEYAVLIWESLISTPVPIKVLARWENLDKNILALSRPSTFHVNFKGALKTDVYYPVALAEKFSGRDINSCAPDIVCTFNSRFPWYFGIDGNTPVNQYDFVSSVLHELTHGLGIAGFLKDEKGIGFIDSGNNLPSIYDFFINNIQNQQITDQSLFNRPSSVLHQQLTCGTLKFSKTSDTGINDWLYAPSKWKEGASIYHLDLHNDNGLMTPFANLGEAIHDPGKNTLKILSDIGWEAVIFDFSELKDLEETCDTLPVTLRLRSDFELDSTSVELIYSFDNFFETDTVKFRYNSELKQFYGNMPIKAHTGNINYFIRTQTSGNREFCWPVQAPEYCFNFFIGPDNTAPQLVHNPVKMINKSKPGINFLVGSSDNVGIKSVKVEYKIDGILQEPFFLESCDVDFFQGELNLSKNISGNNNLQYRIIAEDKSLNKNKRILPSNGFYSIQIYEPDEPVVAYYNNFENNTSDFILTDFTISRLPGFRDGILHTRHPYPMSALESEKYDMIAQLRYPIILQEDGIMQFDEVVLVEPGEENLNSEQLVWDYVIVEGSKDKGNSWYPVREKYHSGNNTIWESTYKSAINNGTSVAVGNENLIYSRSINLTENTIFSDGDTVIFRFRLASDNTENGWGWAIDNLEVQSVNTGNERTFTNNKIQVYPNPCSGQAFINFSGNDSRSVKQISITDLYGNTIYENANINLTFDNKIRINLSRETPGIYFIKVKDETSSYITKVIKL